MLTWPQIVKGLQDRNLPVVARETGLAYKTIWRIRNGKVSNPPLSTMTALSEYLQRKPGA